MEIKLHDGTVLAGEARMPNGGTRDVNLKLADGTKKEVESEDIAYLTAWNPKMPDSKFAMVYKDKKWMTPKAVGEHVAIFAYLRNSETLTPYRSVCVQRMLTRL